MDSTQPPTKDVVQKLSHAFRSNTSHGKDQISIPDPFTVFVLQSLLLDEHIRRRRRRTNGQHRPQPGCEILATISAV